ncbi:MAG: hypothetical protein ACRCTE_02785 [Cellulosilyticaceae bacterium]
MQICKIYLCSKQIVATYVTYRKIRGTKGSSIYSPELSYRVAHECYTGTTDETYLTQKRLEKHYQSGRKYNIWICPKYPHLFVTDRKIHLKSIVCIVSGVLFIVAPLMC